MLDQHAIQWAPLKKPVTAGGISFTPDHAYGVVLDQPQYRLILGIFDTSTQFQDSLFYDVSAWTLPLAFGLEYQAVPKSTGLASSLGETGNRFDQNMTSLTTAGQAAAYVFDWNHYLSPLLTYKLLDAGYRLRTATTGFSAHTAGGIRTFSPGAILLAPGIQSKKIDIQQLEQWGRDCGIQVFELSTGLTPSGSDLGSRDFYPLTLPRILLVAGEGIRAYDAGEIWHLLDQRYHIPVTIVSPQAMANTDLGKYTSIVLPSGTSNAFSAIDRERLGQWIKEGGTLIAFDRAISWLNSNGFINASIRKQPQAQNGERLAYATERAISGAQFVGGAIFRGKLDLTHPLCFGYERDELALFKRGTLSLDWADNPWADPVAFATDPLWSGYASDSNQTLIGGSSALQIHGSGSGRIICFAHNPVFRGYWLGTNRLFANSVFFGGILDGSTVAR